MENAIEWQGDWAVSCGFSTKKEILSLKTATITECNSKCEQLYDCTHFTFVFRSAICSLNFGQIDKSSVVKLNSRNNGCGLTDQSKKKLSQLKINFF